LEQQTPCTCSDEKRAITGTYCTPEVRQAVEKGYKILKSTKFIIGMKQHSTTQAHKKEVCFQNTSTLFLKLKQQASDWPEWAKTLDDAKRYIDNYFEKEGVVLDWDMIQKNPGLRALAKLCLNSFWGKFGHRLNMRQTQLFHETESDKFFQVLSDRTK